LTRLTYKYIKEQFEKEGYTLISKEYTNNYTHLLYKCPIGHTNSIVYSSWQQGRRCPKCAKNKRLNINEIRLSFEKEGYTLLSKEYENAKSLLEYECPNGHNHKTSADNFRRGYRCPYCNGRPVITIKEAKEVFEQEGYILLTNIYINGEKKLKYKCPVGHIHSVGLTSFKSGVRCPTCSNIKMSGSGHPNWKGGISCEPYCVDWTKEYKNFIKERDGYRCLNPDCTKRHKRLHVHHIDYIKKNCSMENLITLCGSCNSRANYERDWHQSWYQSILHNRYNYKY